MKKKVFAMLLVFCMMLTTITPAMAIDAIDVDENYWGLDAIEHLNNLNIMQGFKGYFRPNEPMTRVEFLAIINRAFGFEDISEAKEFKDVDYNLNDWKATEIKKSSSQGIILGSNGYARPNSNISREEAFVLLARVMKLKNKLNSTSFNDDNLISDWAKNDIAAMWESGYIIGSDNLINPKDNISRAEAAQVVDNILGTLFNLQGEVNANNQVYNNVTINKGGITLKNAIINGDLYITEGVGTDDVVLENVIVKGRTLISGGGINSIKLVDSKLNIVDINVPKNNKVRIIVSGESEISTTNVYTNAILENNDINANSFKNVFANMNENDSLDIKANIASIEIINDNLNINLLDGKMDAVVSNGSNTNFNISKDTSIAKLTINSFAIVNGEVPDNIIIKDGIAVTINGKVFTSKTLNSSDNNTATITVNTKNTFDNALSAIDEKEYNGQKFTAKPLIILMDFPNYKHTDLDTKENWRINAFSGSDTTPDFYKSLFFGDNYYTTEDGKQHITVNKFFMEESGGSYELKGDVFGWYTAPKNIEYYGYNDPDCWGGSDQRRARELAEEALKALIENNPDIDLSQYDVEDKWDIDNDGNYDEPDGIVDTVVVLHAGLGEEWGGGSVGDDAIWPFRIGFSWYDYDLDLNDPLDALNLKVEDEYGNTPAYKFIDGNGATWFAEDFTIFEQDLPVDLFCHEYGHVLGLPDLYSAGTPPVENWSLMGGSYTGNPRGSEPVSYGALCKQLLQADFEMRGRNYANWQNSIIVDLNNVDNEGMDVVLDQASLKGQNNDSVIINLPQYNEKIVDVDGDYAYYSGNDNSMENYMIITDNLNLQNVTTQSAISSTGAAITLSFDAWWAIEDGWDFFAVQAKELGSDTWITLNDTTGYSTDQVDQWILNNESENEKLDRNPGWAITGFSEEWLNISYDLSQFAGKEIEVRFRMRTDSNTTEYGIFIDNVVISKENDILFSDDAEDTSRFDLQGFKKSEGYTDYENHYYILEWRNSGANTLVDKGLETINIGRPTLEYDPGLIIWYVNEKYNKNGKQDQNNYNHKNNQYAGIIDADQNPVLYKYETQPWEGADYVNYQMHDAAFSLRQGTEINITAGSGDNVYHTIDDETFMNPVFSDSNDYTAIKCEPSRWMGISLVEYGLNVFVTDESSDRSTAKIHIALDKGLNNFGRQNDEIIESIEMNETALAVTTDKQYNAKAYAKLVGQDGTYKQVVLEYRNGKYTANDTFNSDNNWQIMYLIFEDEQNNCRAIYNSSVYKIFGIDFNSLIK